MDRKQWLEWRRNGIGSSDAPIIMNVSKWSTPNKLFKEKISDEPIKEESSFVMERGNTLEPIARTKFAATFNLLNDADEDFAAQTVESEELPFLRASLDGISKDGETIIEIKFQGREPHEAARRGVVPTYYYPQCQHGLLVSGAKRCFFISINTDHDVVWVEVPRNEEYMVEMIKKHTEFWEAVQKEKAALQKELAPIEVGNVTLQPPDDKVDDNEIEKLFSLRFQLANQIKELESQKKDVEHQLAKLADGKPMNVGRYSLAWVSRAGNVDYGSIPELFNVDLEKYRKPGTTYPQFKENK